MRRVILDDSEGSQDNLLFHLTRYKFASRLVRPTDRLIEIGCGSGYGARYLSDYVREAVAIDAETKMVEYAQKRFVKGNLSYDTDVRDRAAFDIVVCFEVIEHMGKEEGRKLLSSVRRMMAPNGFAIISTPRKIPNPSENRKKHHIHEYEYEEFRETLERVFGRVLIFTQIDEIVSTHHPSCAWNYVAVCYY